MDRPLVTEDNAVGLADEIFGLKVDSSSVDTVKELDSYDDRNFYIWGVKDGEEGAYLLKVYNGCFYSRDFVDAAHKVMFCLKAGGVICPVPQKTMSGECVKIRNFKATPSSQHKVKKPKHDAKEELFSSYVCLFTFVPGKTMKDRKVHGHVFNDDTYYNIGQFVANIANVLKVCNNYCLCLEWGCPHNYWKFPLKSQLCWHNYTIFQNLQFFFLIFLTFFPEFPVETLTVFNLVGKYTLIQI